METWQLTVLAVIGIVALAMWSGPLMNLLKRKKLVTTLEEKADPVDLWHQAKVDLEARGADAQCKAFLAEWRKLIAADMMPIEEQQ